MTPIEAIQSYLGHLNEVAAEGAERQQRIEEHLAELSDQFGRIESLLGNFVKETEKLRAESRERSRAQR